MVAPYHARQAVFQQAAKSPTVEWAQFQLELPLADEIDIWFDTPIPPGIASVNGAVSGNKETIDFDNQADIIFPAWCELVEAECPGLIARLSIVLTPRPGYHVHYRCIEVTIPGGSKLAMDPAAAPREQTLIETRGEGNYVIVPGSPACCHETGRLYQNYSGPPATKVPTITAGERELLLRCARSFDCKPNDVREPQQSTTNGHGAGLRPGDDYNARGSDWDSILSGWTLVREQDQTRYWRRPGKEGKVWSATTGVCQGSDRTDRFYVFSSNAAPFEEGRTYSKFAAYALLQHGGDFGAAAKALASQGYGDQCHRHNGQAQKTNGTTAQRSESTKGKSRGELIIRRASDITPERVHWLWQLWIARGSITIMDGDPGLGKSTITTDLAARVSRGWQMPPGIGPGNDEPSGVLLLSAEDDASKTIRPRLDAAGADATRVHVLGGVRDGNDNRPAELPWHFGLIEKFIKENQVALVVIDPFVAYLDGHIDAHKDQEVRRCMHQLKEVAERTCAAVVLVRHLNKLGHNTAIYRGGGSIGIVAAARSALLVGRHPDLKDTFVLTSNKTNLGRRPRSLTYSLVPTGDVARVGWGEETDLTANDVVGNPSTCDSKSKLDQCVEAMRDALVGHPMTTDDLNGMLQEQGFSEASIRRARRELKVKSRKVGDFANSQWMVFLDEPEGANEGAQTG